MLGIVKKYPVVFVPFIFIALCDAAALAWLFFSPREPVSVVMAPIISRFWGEPFLHYPANFLLLPNLYGYAKNLVDLTFGVLFTAVSISMITQAFSKGSSPQWFHGLQKGLRYYLRLAILWGLTMGLVIVSLRAFDRYAAPLIGFPGVSPAVSFIISIGIQAIFVFAIPAVVIENRKVFRAVKRSLEILKHHPQETFFMVFLPSLLLVPALTVNLPALMDKFFPEVTLLVMGARILLVILTDFLITAGVTVLFLRHRERYGTGRIA